MQRKMVDTIIILYIKWDLTQSSYDRMRLEDPVLLEQSHSIPPTVLFIQNESTAKNYEPEWSLPLFLSSPEGKKHPHELQASQRLFIAPGRPDR
jgi:hypothetical protein